MIEPTQVRASSVEGKKPSARSFWLEWQRWALWICALGFAYHAGRLIAFSILGSPDVGVGDAISGWIGYLIVAPVLALAIAGVARTRLVSIFPTTLGFGTMRAVIIGLLAAALSFVSHIPNIRNSAPPVSSVTAAPKVKATPDLAIKYNADREIILLDAIELAKHSSEALPLIAAHPYYKWSNALPEGSPFEDYLARKGELAKPSPVTLVCYCDAKKRGFFWEAHTENHRVYYVLDNDLLMRKYGLTK
jgi:hypothetical protein